MSILVAGATGNIGSELIEILASGGHDVRALVRDPARARLPPGATAVVGNLDDPSTLDAALTGVEGAFFLPGYRDMPGVYAAARRAGVARVVQLSGSSVETGDRGNAVSRYMLDTEDALRESGLPATVLRPNGFMSNALRWLPQLRDGDVIRDAFPDVPVSMIDPRDIADVAAHALTSDDHVGQVYRLSGPERLLPADRVRILAAALDRPLRFEGWSNDEAYATMSQQMPVEYVDAFFNFYVDGAIDESQIYPTVAAVTGRPPRTFTQWTQAHVDALR